MEIGEHDDSLDFLLQHHHPELLDGVGKRALAGDVGILVRISVDEIGVDVVTSGHVQIHRTQANASRVVAGGGRKMVGGGGRLVALIVE